MLKTNSFYILISEAHMQNQNQAQLQEFFNSVQQIQSTPPERVEEVLSEIRNFYEQLNDPTVLGFAFMKFMDVVLRFKQVSDSVRWLIDQSICDIITKSVQSQFRVGTQALKLIFDYQFDYYRHSNLDPSLVYPLGNSRKLNWYEPSVGQKVDVVKPYITSTSFCSWTRGILLSKQDKKYTVKYNNTQTSATFKEMPFFAPLGTRTTDYDWRMSLHVGSLVDGFNRIWYSSTITETGFQNGSQRVRVSFRRFNDNGSKVDALGRSYDGLGPNEDDWCDVLSYRIQKPGKMAHQLCYYSFTAEQPITDDTYDLLFEKQYEQQPFWGIMRCTLVRSTSYVNFFEHLCNQRAYDIFLNILEQKDYPIDPICNLFAVFGITSQFTPRMGVHRYLPRLLGAGIKYLKQHCKQFVSWRLQCFSVFVQNICKRLYSLSRKHRIVSELKRFLILQYFKLNLQKNMIALKYLYELIKPVRPYEEEQQREQFHNFLLNQKIFYTLVQSNMHQQVLSRSSQIIKYMITCNIIGWKEIEHIWNLVPHSDLRGRSTIQKLLAEISQCFPIEFIEQLIGLLLNTKETDLTIDKLHLLRILKNRDISSVFKQKILHYLWQSLTVKSGNIKQNVEEQIENVFRAFISTLKQSDLKLSAIKAMLKRLHYINSVRHEMVLFKEFILTYPTKLEANGMAEEQDCPQTIKEVIVYLKSQRIYENVFRLLQTAKNKEKATSILQFIQFLFEHDSDDISQNLKQVYDMLGPTDIFLSWAKNLTYRALNFFFHMYENVHDMERFEKITTLGLEAIKTILLDINVYKGNIKVLKKRKGSELVGPLPNIQSCSNVGTSTKSNSVLVERQQVSTLVYVLRSPFECIGLSFLMQLLQYVSSNKVYTDIIKLIIQFIVNLDEKIKDKYELFMSQFLRRIIENMATIGQANQFNDRVKLQIDTYLNLIQQLFNQTEKNGLADIKPHFTLIDSEIIKLKVQNTIANSNLHKKEPYSLQINQNSTFWDLKVKLGHIYDVPAIQLDVFKYITPIQDTNNGKSLSQLFFFNQELIKISKRDPEEIPRSELLQEENETPTFRFERIIQKWFFEYKNKRDLLGFQQLKRLAHDNWKDSFLKHEHKIKQLIQQEDQDQKDGLSLAEFKQYFVKTARLDSLKVWRLINLSGYNNNLLQQNQTQSQIKPNSYPRKILSTRFVYQTIFSILCSQAFQPVHLNLYRFLGMLETDRQLCLYIKSNIRRFLQHQECIYRLCYGLEALINQLESNLELFGSFYEQDGHNEIAKKLAEYFRVQTSIYSFDPFLKVIVIPNLLRILSIFVYPLISDHPQIRFLKNVKINQFDTLDIINKLNSQQNYAADQAEKRAILTQKSTSFNFVQLYGLAYKILSNLTVNYEKEFLVKITNEIVKLYAYLALVNPQFNPEDILKASDSQSLNIRRSCHVLLYFYLLKNKDKAFQLLQKLIKNAPEQTKTLSNTYFDLTAIILEKTIQFSPDNEDTHSFLGKLVSDLIECFFGSRNHQQRGTLLPNKTVQGILSNILIIVKKKPRIAQNLSEQKQKLIEVGLFAYGVEQKIQKFEISQNLLVQYQQPELIGNYVKCKTAQNRKILMEIIYYLYKADSSHQNRNQFFEKFIFPVINQLVDTSKKNSLRIMHVGLTNFGSTCYLNSMLQVLNATDIFRNAIMKVQVETPLIYQLKSLFSFLFFSERIEYTPKNLLNSFVPPINSAIQQDTTEFLNFLFDQLEESLRQTPYKNILNELFQGNQVGQMICHSCGAKRQRIQQFFTYSVEIEGKYDLHAALEGMYAGELISDCLCESCGKRSDTTKRNILNVVPNFFFVHLKRIIFDYNMFMNTKIHTRLYFPDQLNFQPYTKQGLELREQLGVQYLKTLQENQQQKKKFEQLALHGHPKEYYQLKLKGVIVHSGTADVGHYYTIIKKDKDWIKFDDSRITNFSADMFEQECYGGNWVADQWGGSGTSKNAYVLIYQKQMKKDIILQISWDKKVQRKMIPYQQFTKITNTPYWYKKVWLDNHSLMLQQHLISQNYTKQFLNFVCKMLDLIDSTSTIDLISQIFFKISALSGQVGNLPEMFERNLNLITLQHFHTYLSDQKCTFNLLFHQQLKVRQFASFYFDRILIHHYLCGTQKEKDQVKAFIEHYLKILQQDAAKSWMRIDGYFKMFQRIVRSVCIVPQLQSLYHFLIRKDIIAYFADFILQKASPLAYIKKKYSLGTKCNPVNFSSGLYIIFLFVQRSFGTTGINYESPIINSNYLHHLSDNSIMCLSSMAFYEKMIKENQNPHAMAAIIQRLAINNLPFSQAVARVLLKIVTQNNDVSNQLENVLLCVSSFLKINDQIYIKRAEALLGVPTPFIYQKNILTSLDEEKYVYPSALENMFPLQSLLNYAHINRRRVPLTVLNILKTILQGTSINEQAIEYILKIPSPSYIYLRYIDWIRPYINSMITQLNLKQKKAEQVQCKVSIYQLDKRKKEMSILVLGEIGQRKLVESRKSQNGDIEFNIYNIPAFVTQSYPNGNGNHTFDKYLTNNRLEKTVCQSSNILKFFKQSGKPIALKPQYMQQHQEKELVSLFDQTPYNSLNSASQMQVESGKGNQVLKEQVKKEAKIQNGHAQQNGKNKRQKQMEEQINIENAYLSQDYLRCIQIVNKSDTNKVVVMTFYNPHQSNATIPSSLKFMLSKNKEEFYYTKENPFGQWADDLFSEYVYNYVENPKFFFKLYSCSNKQNGYMAQTKYNKQDSLQNTKEDNKMDIQNANKDELIVNSQIDAMANCRVCTFLNPVTNTSCEVCQTPL